MEGVKKNVDTLIKNYFIAKKKNPLPEPLVNCNLFTGGGSCVYVDENTICKAQ